MDVRRDRPAAITAGPREIAHMRAAQPVSGHEERNGFEQVGLARAVGACEHLRLGPGFERQARIAAEVRQLDALDGEAE